VYEFVQTTQLPIEGANAPKNARCHRIGSWL
jgi:hypothetical protein